MIHFGDVSFKTQTSAKAYVRSLMQEIGICQSVKGKSYDYYDKLLAITQRHPDSDQKLENMCDFAIVPNKLNRKAVYIQCIVIGPSATYKYAIRTASPNRVTCLSQLLCESES